MDTSRSAGAKVEPPGGAGRQLAVAAAGFMLPLALFFGWFFGILALSFTAMSLIVAALFVLSLGLRAAYKGSRIVGLGTTWLTVGCLAALFWALLLNGFG